MMGGMPYRYLFGPVPSRRLGLSLGIDLFTEKTCTLDCVYCECGPTRALTRARKEYVPTGEVIAELDRFLQPRPALDHLTFAGAGEPTLHRGLGKIIRHLKDHHPGYPVALLTNGTLLADPRVRAEILPCDVIIPSLDAVSPPLFMRLNRPACGIGSDTLLAGLQDLRAEYRGDLRLEIFLVPGLNDTDPELAKLAAAVAAIKPDRVQLNTLDRSGAEAWVAPLGAARLRELAARFPGPVEIVARGAAADLPHRRFQRATD